MKGYKVFNPDWTCRDFRYEVGKTYEIEDKPVLCGRGFHFCEKAVDCFRFYEFNSDNKVAEVEALGEVIGDGCKSCTNRITIVRELSWDEVLRVVNIGRGCTGFKNSGNGNSGSFNSGSCNSGSCNSGDYNATDYSSGCFNTQPDKIQMFNRPTSWTMDDWRSSEACKILMSMPYGSRWVAADVMNKEEKAKHPEAETTSGYLKETDDAMHQEWWNGLSDIGKATIKSMPNFDAEIFKQITGICV